MIDFSTELYYKTSRSSGAGGQNVNKVETAVTVMWKGGESQFFFDFQKSRIYDKLINRINSEGVLQLTVTETRTQLQNKKLATEKILSLVNEALSIPKKRLKTKPSKSKIQKRLNDKKKIGEKKENRKFKGE
jgi:ribosome-associated protein